MNDERKKQRAPQRLTERPCYCGQRATLRNTCLAWVRMYRRNGWHLPPQYRELVP